MQEAGTTAGKVHDMHAMIDRSHTSTPCKMTKEKVSQYHS